MMKTCIVAGTFRSAVIGLAIATSTVTALAHAKLLSIDPAAATQLRLTFSEGIEIAFSRVTVVDSGQKDIKLNDLELDPADSKILVVTAPEGFGSGHYTLKWSVVSTDGHKIEGSQEYDLHK